MSKQIYKVFERAQELLDISIAINGPNYSGSDLDLASLIPLHLLGRRTVLVIERVSSLEQSSLNILDADVIESNRYSLEDVEGVAVNGLNCQSMAVFDHEVSELYIQLSCVTPLIANAVPEGKDSKIPLLSQLLYFYIVFIEKRGSCLKPLRNRAIYEGYGTLGFFLVHQQEFSQFLRERLGAGKHDLVEKFTSTELANELFDAGLIVLCWGITPWVYMITSQEEDKDSLQFPENFDATEKGFYKFRSSITEVSVIPGDALSRWDTEETGEWPMLEILGDGNVVELEFCNLKAFDELGVSFTPVPLFKLKKTHRRITASVPLLSIDIKI